MTTGGRCRVLTRATSRKNVHTKDVRLAERTAPLERLDMMAPVTMLEAVHLAAVIVKRMMLIAHDGNKKADESQHNADDDGKHACREISKHLVVGIFFIRHLPNAVGQLMPLGVDRAVCCGAGRASELAVMLSNALCGGEQHGSRVAASKRDNKSERT